MCNCNCGCRCEDIHSRSENYEHAVFGGVVALIGFGFCALFAYDAYTSPLPSGIFEWAAIAVTLLIGVGGVWYCCQSILEAKTCRKGT